MANPTSERSFARDVWNVFFGGALVSLGNLTVEDNKGNKRSFVVVAGEAIKRIGESPDRGWSGTALYWAVGGPAIPWVADEVQRVAIERYLQMHTYAPDYYPETIIERFRSVYIAINSREGDSPLEATVINVKPEELLPSAKGALNPVETAGAYGAYACSAATALKGFFMGDPLLLASAIALAYTTYSQIETLKENKELKDLKKTKEELQVTTDKLVATAGKLEQATVEMEKASREIVELKGTLQEASTERTELSTQIEALMRTHTTLLAQNQALQELLLKQQTELPQKTVEALQYIFSSNNITLSETVQDDVKEILNLLSDRGIVDTKTLLHNLKLALKESSKELGDDIKENIKNILEGAAKEMDKLKEAVLQNTQSQTALATLLQRNVDITEKSIETFQAGAKGRRKS